MGIKVFVEENYWALSRMAAGIIEGVILDNPFSILGLATGNTPKGLYKQLVDDYRCGIISFSNVRTVNLDEYVGVSSDDPRSYAFFMKNFLFRHIDIPFENTNIPNGVAEDLDDECRRYSSVLRNLKRDIQLLGIGSDGHIGFNEPGTSFDSTTYIAELEKSTRRDNSGPFGGEDKVPKRAITMGISDIMSAKKILLLASGENKARAVYAMLKGKVREECPASVLQNHNDVTVILDQAAARLI